MRKHKIIAYVSTNDLGLIKEDDLKRLDVINIAFGHIHNGLATWNYKDNLKYIEAAKNINPNLKFVLSIGGWSAGGFSEVASTEQSRLNFAKSAVKIVTDCRLDGLDIDWEYPCYSVAGISASKDDKKNFTLYIKALREELNTINKDYMLTIAVGAGNYFTRGTEMDIVQQYLDYVQLMTYDMIGGFSMATGHHTNLYTPTVSLSDSSVDTTVKVFVDAGVPIEKLVIGVAFYSRQWSGVPNVDNGYMQHAKTAGGYGPGYSDLIEKYVNKNNFIRYWDDEAKAPYLFDGNIFITYDDTESIKYKAEYVKEKNILGIMYWEYGCDRTFTLTKCIRSNLD